MIQPSVHPNCVCEVTEAGWAVMGGACEACTSAASEYNNLIAERKREVDLALEECQRLAERMRSHADERNGLRAEMSRTTDAKRNASLRLRINTLQAEIRRLAAEKETLLASTVGVQR